LVNKEEKEKTEEKGKNAYEKKIFEKIFSSRSPLKTSTSPDQGHPSWMPLIRLALHTYIRQVHFFFDFSINWLLMCK
jgi:hypothetical protein